MRCAELGIAVLVVAWSQSSAASSTLRGPPSFKDQMGALRKKLSADEEDNHDHGHDRDRDHDGDHDRDHDNDHDNDHDHDKSTVDEEETPMQKTLKHQLADVPEDGLAHLGKSLSSGGKSASKGGNLKINQTAAASKGGTGLASRAENPTAALKGEAGAASAAASLSTPAEIGILVEGSCGQKLTACSGMCIHGPVGQLACLVGVKAPYVTSAISAAAFAKPTIVRGQTCESLGFSEEAPAPPASQGGSKVSVYLSPGWTHTFMAKIADHPPAVAAIKDGWLHNLKRASVMCD